MYRIPPSTVLWAIDKSWKHWDEDNVKGGPPFAIYARDCPLCRLFEPTVASCNGCPISVYTGQDACEGTPWVQCQTAVGEFHRALGFKRKNGPIPLYTDMGRREAELRELMKAERDFIAEVRNWFIQIKHLW